MYTTQKGQGYGVYADGSFNIGGVLGSCDTVLQSVQQGPPKLTPREGFRQIEACEEAGFSVPGSEALPETAGPPVLAALAALLLLGGTGISLGVRW